MRTFTKIRFVVATLVALALAPFSAHAQFVGGNATLSAGTVSSNVALPANTVTYPYVLIVPAEGSSNEVFYKLGLSSSVVATTSGPALPAGGVCINSGPNTYLAGITGSSTTTVRVTQVTLCPIYSGGAGAGGGGGGGTSSNFSSAFPSVGTAVGFSNGTNMVPGLVDGSGYLEVNVKAGGAGGGAVYGPTAVGSATANPPVSVGGSVDGTSTGNVGIWKVDSSGTGYIDAVSAGNLLSAIANPINGLSGSAQSSSNPMGWVNINQTTPGTTNGVDPTTIARWGLMSGTTPGTAPTNTLITGGIYNSTVPTLTTGQTAPLQVGPHGGLLIGGGGYPIGSTPITISGTGTTGATTATLATGASVTTYICGFSIRANATAAATGNATVTGTITGTLNYTQWTAPNASGLGVAEQIFTPCIPASGTNQAIAVISAAPGTGGVVSVTAWGFTL